MIDVVDRYIRINDAMRPVKSQQSDKQGDEKDSKKKGDKSALVNPALKSGNEGSIICQICLLEHSAINCPLVKELRNQSAVRRGELFPGKSDKDGKKKGAKGSQEFNLVEDATEKVCLLCSQLKNIPEGAAKNHTTQECGQFAKFNKLRGEGVDMESSDRYSKDRSGAGSLADQSHCSTETMQNQYYEPLPPGPR